MHFSNSDITNAFKAMHYDLDHNKAISSTAKNKANDTLLDFEIIFEDLGNLSKVASDDERAALINKTIKEKGGKGGLEEAPSVNAIEDRIDLFVGTYFKAKHDHKEDQFFSCFIHGDPCLSGRISSLSNFAAGLEGINVKDIPNEDVIFQLPGLILTDDMVELIEDQGIPINDLTVTQFQAYLLVHIDSIANKFEKTAAKRPEMAQNFLDYLERNGMYKSPDPVDWSLLLPKLIQDKCFLSIHNFILPLAKTIVE